MSPRVHPSGDVAGGAAEIHLCEAVWLAVHSLFSFFSINRADGFPDCFIHVKLIQKNDDFFYIFACWTLDPPPFRPLMYYKSDVRGGFLFF